MWIVEKKLLNFDLQIHKKFIFFRYIKELLTLNFPASKQRFSYKETGVSLKSGGQTYQSLLSSSAKKIALAKGSEYCIPLFF